MKPDMFDEEALRRRKNKKAELQERWRKKQIDDFAKVLSLPEGRRLLWRIMEEASVFKTTFTGNSTTFFNEGKRSIGLMVLGEVMVASPEKFQQMQNEFSNEQKARAKLLEE
jgi:hypothetical protein